MFTKCSPMSILCRRSVGFEFKFLTMNYHELQPNFSSFYRWRYFEMAPFVECDCVCLLGLMMEMRYIVLRHQGIAVLVHLKIVNLKYMTIVMWNLDCLNRETFVFDINRQNLQNCSVQNLQNVKVFSLMIHLVWCDFACNVIESPKKLNFKNRFWSSHHDYQLKCLPSSIVISRFDVKVIKIFV